MTRKTLQTFLFILTMVFGRMTIASPSDLFTFTLSGGTILIMRSQDRYDSLFQFYANDVDWLLMKAQAKAESNMNPDAISPVGAKGLAQFVSGTWAEWGEGDPTNPEKAIKAQCAYMSHLDSLFKDTRLTLSAYNWGQGNVRKAMAKWGPTFEHIQDHMPKETQTYVPKILGFREGYRDEISNV
jgi:soluble lytic murein transglycosylase-like protein